MGPNIKGHWLWGAKWSGFAPQHHQLINHSALASQWKVDDTYHHRGGKIKQYVWRELDQACTMWHIIWEWLGQAHLSSISTEPSRMEKGAWGSNEGGMKGLGGEWNTWRSFPFIPVEMGKSGLESLVLRSTWIAKPGRIHSSVICTSLRWTCGFHLLPFTSSQTWCPLLLS